MKVEVKGLSKRFEDRLALDDVGFQVPEGKITAIVGPSGSGKTTLLRIINMLDRPTKGKLVINGKDPAKNGHSQVLKKMVMVFQNPVMFNRSVIANVSYGLKVRRVDKTKVKDRSEKALERVGLGDRAGQYAPTLSAGESQRMAFARGLVLEPELMLLDEFTANLDPGNVALLEKLVMDYNKDSDSTIVLATHNLYQAKRLSHHCIFLFDGKLIEKGRTKKMFSSPKDPLTKKFLSGEIAW